VALLATRTLPNQAAAVTRGEPAPSLATRQLVAEEAAIVAAVLDGQIDAFRLLVNRYQGKLISTLHRMVGTRHEAEDLAQQSFLDAFDALPRFDRERRFSTWLFRIAINNAKDWLKSHKRGERSLDHSVSSDAAVFCGQVPDPARSAQANQELAQVERALAALPLPFREVIILKDVQGLSYAEIQEILGHPITTLKIRAVRGRAALRDALERAGEGRE
jgi:RNA polymerase sigma-70 factor, ECF subfamily